MAVSKEQWSPKLLQLLQKLTNSNLACMDESYFDKVLTLIAKELDRDVNSSSAATIIAWLRENAKLWPTILKNPAAAAFLPKLLGTAIRGNDTLFKSILGSGGIEFLSSDLAGSESSALRCNYVAALTHVAGLREGRKWIMAEGKWMEVLKLATDDKSLYVQRQATIFIRLLLKSETENLEFIEQVLKHLMKQIECHIGSESGNVVTPYLRLIDAICEDCIESEEGNKVSTLLVEKFRLDEVLKKSLEGPDPRECVVSSYAHILLTSLPSDASQDEEHSNIKKLLEMFKILVRTGHVCHLLKLSRVCHILWLKLNVRRRNVSVKIEMHFFVTLLMPLLVSLRKCAHSKMLDTYVSKLLDLASEETFRLAYMARDAIRVDPPISISQKAVASIHGLMDYHQQLDHEKTVLLFQTLVWVLKNFVPTTCDVDEDPAPSEIVETRHLCVTLTHLLNAVLSALCTITEECKVSWSEAFEGLCILMLCHWLLKNPELPSKTTVLTLRMTRLAIAQFMPPNLALLVDDVKGTSMEGIGPILQLKLHDPHWEVRDSALEVVTVIADLSLNKFPVFQEFLLELKYYPLIVSILEGDSESYVRASAIKSIISIVPVTKVWNACLVNLEVPRLVMGILRGDTEGIVRREAALLIAAMYQNGRIPGALLGEAYETMLKIMTSDLHWEVKVNGLDFWSRVIENRLQEQGMVDGVFPPVTFSRENKKITTLTEAEIKLRLSKVMTELSKLGCLNALLQTLYDDCDAAVVNKSTKVTGDFVAMLRLYNFLPVEVNDGKKRKPGFPFDGKPEKVLTNRASNSSPQCNKESSSSADVIEDIVNATDMKLLAGVLVGTEQNNGCCCKEAVEMVDVETFLTHIQDVDFAESSEEINEQDQDVSNDLSALLDAVLSISGDSSENNVPDCY